MRASKQTAKQPVSTKTTKPTKVSNKTTQAPAQPDVGRVDDRARIVSVDSIKPWANNPRLNADAVPVVAGSIAEFDFNDPIIVCRQTNEIVAGNTRYKAALELGLKEVPFGDGPRLKNTRRSRVHLFGSLDRKGVTRDEQESPAVVSW